MTSKRAKKAAEKHELSHGSQNNESELASEESEYEIFNEEDTARHRKRKGKVSSRKLWTS